jgi:hypothetical protein
MRNILRAFILIVVVLTSCGPTQEELARAKVTLANNFLQNSDTVQAIAQLDSVILIYPKAVYTVNAAKKTLEEIYIDILSRKQGELAALNEAIPSFESNFVTEKTEYDRYTQYIHKRQRFDSRWNKSYLKVNLDERGEISFSSNYYGQSWLNHTGIRVYDGNTQASTGKIELNDPNNHRSDFMDSKWEKVTYTNSKGDEVIKLIADNPELKIKAVFLGSSEYYIVLEDYDKIAFHDALALSKMLKAKVTVENEIKQLQKRLNIEE